MLISIAKSLREASIFNAWVSFGRFGNKRLIVHSSLKI